jgi:hypothetical protein
MASRDKSKGLKSQREQREARRRRQKTLSTVRWGGLVVFGLAIVGFLVWLGTRPVSAIGDEVVVTSAEHVPTGSDSGPYPTNPPAGGKHYAETYTAGFYEEADLEGLPKNYEGYLVHNLEHGHVIFWYNCAASPDTDCDALKSSIRQVMDEFNNSEVVAFPWDSQAEPLVMTSWGRILRFEQVNLDKMREFVRINRNKSPEAEAD